MEKKKVLIICGFVVAILIIILSVVMIVKASNEVKKDKNGEVLNNTKVKGDLKENTKTEVQEEEKEDDNMKDSNMITKESVPIEGTPVTDINLKKDIINKVNALLGFKHFAIDKNYAYTFFDSRLVKLLKKDYDNTYKLALALEATEGYELEKYPKVNNKIRSVNKEYREKLQKKTAVTNDEGLIYIDIIDIDDLKQTYKSLFNEEISEFVEEINSLVFNNYIYDKDNNVYYKGTGGGGWSGYAPFIYINNITMKNEYIYVYINMGYMYTESNNGITKLNVYDSKTYSLNDKKYADYEVDPVVYTIFEAKDDEYYKELDKNRTTKVDVQHIDESNYDKFTNYRIIFKKNSEGNYYFVDVD